MDQIKHLALSLSLSVSLLRSSKISNTIITVEDGAELFWKILYF